MQDNNAIPEVFTIRILIGRPKTRLEKLAKTMDHTKSGLAAQVIRAYVDLNEREIQPEKHSWF